LQKICDKHPTLKVVYSSDEEGNSFSLVEFPPQVGDFKDGEFIAEENFEEWEEDSGRKYKVTAVLIN
jgi:hypothetical protein